jgi:DNA polymerase-3 subunit epsilon
MRDDSSDFQGSEHSGELPEWAKRIVVFDTETTGLNLKTARIVTACVAELDADGKLVGPAQEWLANPEIEIPEAASNVHGITTEMAREAGRNAAEVVAEIIAALRGYFERGIPVVAYNAPYDFTILHWEAIRHGLTPLDPRPVLDPLVLDRAVDQYRKGKRRLENAAEYYGVQLSDAHNATADAVASGRVLQAMARKFAGKLSADVDEVHNAQVDWSAAQEASFAKWMRANANPDFKENLGWPLKLNSED